MPSPKDVKPVSRTLSAEEMEIAATLATDDLSKTVYRRELLGILAYNIAQTGVITDPISIGPNDLETLQQLRIIGSSYDTDNKHYEWRLSSIGHRALSQVSIDSAALESEGAIRVRMRD